MKTHVNFKKMIKKKKAKKTNSQQLQKVLVEEQHDKNINLLFGGVFLAIGSMGLLIFVFSEKIFHLS